MGVRGLVQRLQGHSSNRLTQVPIPVVNASGKAYVVARNGQLMLEDGTPFRFASMNAPDLLNGEDFEIEDTMRTLAGFGRKVTRTYTLEIEGTSAYLGGRPGHIKGWDAVNGNWIYDENRFKQVKRLHFDFFLYLLMGL